jgi:hypothetical protein
VGEGQPSPEALANPIALDNECKGRMRLLR